MKPDPFHHILTCEHCGREFKSKRADAKYCPDRPGRHCRVEAHREAKGVGSVRGKKVRTKCELCGKSYWTQAPDVAKYCGQRCRKRASYLRTHNKETE